MSDWSDYNGCSCLRHDMTIAQKMARAMTTELLFLSTQITHVISVGNSGTVTHFLRHFLSLTSRARDIKLPRGRAQRNFDNQPQDCLRTQVRLAIQPTEVAWHRVDSSRSHTQNSPPTLSESGHNAKKNRMPGWLSKHSKEVAQRLRLFTFSRK